MSDHCSVNTVYVQLGTSQPGCPRCFLLSQATTHLIYMLESFKKWNNIITFLFGEDSSQVATWRMVLNVARLDTDGATGAEERKCPGNGDGKESTANRCFKSRKEKTCAT